MYHLYMESLKRSLTSLKRRYTLYMYNLQNGIPQKERFGILRKRYTVFRPFYVNL